MTLILVSFFLIIIIISHTTSVGMTLILVSFFISHTTSVGMTLILVSFFLILIILATKLSCYNSRTSGSKAMGLGG